MRLFSNFVYLFIIFLFFLSCSTVLLDGYDKEDDSDLLTLKKLMVYPELKISNFDIKIYEKLKNYHEHNFEILGRENENFVYLSEDSYRENMKYIKELFFYNKKLYKILLAYSLVQGSPFKSEMFKYLKKHNIKENFSLGIRFPTYKICIDGNNWILIKKDFLDMVIQNKNNLFISNRIMENVVKIFSK
ncbi:hypothetical protein F0310_04890 (plasmid) [Borrelia sp. A-FGy1]|uniref:hypothetical protein n=1 Tax=Borrelia sp. A-FGy1 TaxID=2608247 RepID=UPI0015F4596E|nr:hypothetical protein [Borrelia sp. A-FGy1]QMU99751.1 hypothetical protein F0310_04890 [Borrelia sp. A-FGy1]